MLKIILDTNMVLSAIYFGGMVEKIIDLVVENKLQLFISPTLTKEVLDKLEEFQADEAIVANALQLLKKGQLVTPSIKVTVSRDVKDNYLLELTETVQADFLITRDKDLLDLPNQVWKETKIVKPEEFLPFLRSLKLIS